MPKMKTTGLNETLKMLESIEGNTDEILEDGRQYLITDAVQIVDEDCVELSLERLGKYYEVAD